MDKKQKFIGVGIVVIAFILMNVIIVVNKKKPKKRPPLKAVAVRVVDVDPSEAQARIQSTAVVKANQTLNITPEIAGRVVWISPKLRAGGVVKKGELLVKISDADYGLAVEQSRVQVNRAQLEIDQESARGEVASEEWRVLGDSSQAPDLVLRVQQKEVAKLNLLSAKSALKKARLNLSRCRIRAPFTAYVSNSSVAVGQYVSPQVILARLLEKKHLTAEVSVLLRELQWINIPGINGVKKGSDAYLTISSMEKNYIEREGRVEALIGEIDGATRKAKVRISINESKEKLTPLLPGAFVDVTIFGVVEDGIYTIPREALVRGESVFIVDGESRLKQVKVARLWGTVDDVAVKLVDFEGTARVVISHPQGEANGLKVRPQLTNIGGK